MEVNIKIKAGIQLIGLCSVGISLFPVITLQVFPAEPASILKMHPLLNSSIRVVFFRAEVLQQCGSKEC
jgi:hypothetical protein